MPSLLFYISLVKLQVVVKECGDQGVLHYKQRPAWFDARVDSGALREAQRAVEIAKLKQAELHEVFTPSSAAAKAQAKVITKKRNQLWALEKHLASTLLRSHRTELRGMEASGKGRPRGAARD